MSTYRRSQGKNDWLLGLLIGALAGLLFGCCLGGGMLALSGSSKARTAAPAEPPASYDIEVVVEEDYINRIMVTSGSGTASPVPLTAGHLDLRPGGQADFQVQIEVGPLRPVFDGTVEFVVSDAGQLEVKLSSVRAGYLPVTAFVPASQTRAINQSIGQMLAERAGPFGLRFAGVTSDETTLRLYLALLP